MKTNIKENNTPKEYKHLLGQAVVGFKGSKVLKVNNKGLVTFEYLDNQGSKGTIELDLSKINIKTVSDY